MSAQAWNTLSLRTKHVCDFFSLSGGNCRDFFYPNFESSYLLNGLTDWLDFLYGNIIWPCLLICQDSRNFRYCNQPNQPTYPKISNQRSQKSILWNFLKFCMNNHPTPGQILGELYGDHTKHFLVVCYATLQPLCWSVGPSVGQSHFTFFCGFAVFGLTAPAQMIWWPQLQPLPTRTRLG